MPDLTGLHHVAITVTDLERSAAWYTDVLGLVELFREDGEERRAIVYRLPHGGIAVGLVWFAGTSGSFDPRVVGLDHFSFSVGSREELDAWAAHLDAKGVEHSGVIEVPPGGILNCKDPDGIALAFFWDRD